MMDKDTLAYKIIRWPMCIHCRLMYIKERLIESIRCLMCIRARQIPLFISLYITKISLYELLVVKQVLKNKV